MFFTLISLTDCSENKDIKETLDAMTNIGLCQNKQKDIFQVSIYPGRSVYASCASSAHLYGDFMALALY